MLVFIAILFLIVYFLCFVWLFKLDQDIEEKIESMRRPVDESTIKNMTIHCDVVHDNSGLYSCLNCGICPYKEECRQYKRQHNGKTPIDVLREKKQDLTSIREAFRNKYYKGEEK